MYPTTSYLANTYETLIMWWALKMQRIRRSSFLQGFQNVMKAYMEGATNKGLNAGVSHGAC
jgi:hypothetical protein